MTGSVLEQSELVNKTMSAEAAKPTLRLLGLPFKATRADVVEFLKRCSSITKSVTEEDLNNNETISVTIGGKKKKKTGPKQGECWIVGLSEKHCSKAVQKLNNETIGERWIEVSMLGNGEDGEEGNGNADGAAVGGQTENQIEGTENNDPGSENRDSNEPPAKKRKVESSADGATAPVPEATTTSATASSKDNQAVRLFGLPFSATGSDIKEWVEKYLLEEEKVTVSIDETQDLWVGSLKFATAREHNAPCIGEAWIYNLGEKIGSESAEKLQSTLTSAFHFQLFGARFVEVSIVNTKNCELIWNSPDNERATKIRSEKGIGKGNSKEGKGEKGKGKGKGGEKGEKGSSNLDVNGKEREVFVRFLPYECNEGDVKEFFTRAGTVERVKLFKAGIGFVIFKTNEEAQKAIEDLDGAPWNSRTLKV